MAVFCLSACKSPTAGEWKRYTFTRPQMGTLFTITLHAANGSKATNAAQAAFARVGELNRTFTDYDDESELMRLCHAPAGQPRPVSEDLFAALARAQEFAELSEGSFDPTVGPLVQLWRRARRQRALPLPERIAEAKKRVGHEKLKLDPKRRTATLAEAGMQLDLGGIAKGFAADAALRVLRQHGIKRAMVAASGDFAIGDPPPGRDGWIIGIASIDSRPGKFTRILSLKSTAVSTSGDTEQFVELAGQRYSHIVDPRTGIGLTNRIGVTVVAQDCTTSDALATAISVLGLEPGLRLIEAQPQAAALMVILDPGGAKRLIESTRFSGIASQTVGAPGPDTLISP
jgi:thiamine biosynthesis lipoprotein